jgi:predicted transcriptional regulator
MSGSIPINEIRRRRKALGLSRKQLARLAGVSQSTVWGMEKWKYDPHRGTLAKLQHALEEAEKAAQQEAPFNAASIRPWRIHHRIKLTVLATKAGISYGRLTEIESLKTRPLGPRPATLAKIKNGMLLLEQELQDLRMLRQIRLKAGVTMAELANAAGVTLVWVSKIENGYLPKASTLAKIKAAHARLTEGKVALSGPELKRRREALRLTRVDLAKKARIDISTISEFENGERKPIPRTCRKLEVVLQKLEDEPRAPLFDLTPGALEKERKALGLSIVELARRVGTTSGTISSIEAGVKKAYRLKTLGAIERALAEARNGKVRSAPRLYPTPSRSSKTMPAKKKRRGLGRPPDATIPERDAKIIAAWKRDKNQSKANLGRQFKVHRTYVSRLVNSVK